MTHFLKNGNMYRVSNDENTTVFDLLPPGNYVVKEHQMLGLYLEKIDDFTRPNKIYGNTLKNAKRIINTFMDRPNSTGVMLSGDKGSGKTLLAKVLSLDSAALGIPTIIVNSAFVGDDFNKLLQDISQPSIVMFDEFEKVYDEDKQEMILTLLDGIYSSKKLYVFTINDKFRIDVNLRNRPGRIYYMLDFKGVDEAFIKEYCADRLDNKEHIDTICNISALFDSFNFDILAALVEEMNRYGENAHDAIEMLNAKPEYSNDQNYTVSIKINGKDVERKHIDSYDISINPFIDTYNIGFNDHVTTPDDVNWKSVRLQPDAIARIEPHAGRYVYVFDHVELTLTKRNEHQFKFGKYF